MLTKHEKYLLCTYIPEHRDTVMEGFSSKVNLTDKNKAWQDIADKMKKAGANFKDEDHLRKMWTQISGRLRNKLDDARKTGAGKAEELTETEELIVQIIGKGQCEAEPPRHPGSRGPLCPGGWCCEEYHQIVWSLEI